MIMDLFSAAAPPTMSLRPYQREANDQVIVGFDGDVRKQLVIIPTGGGKCLGRGTPVLMFNGDVRAVETIQPGDLLMGPDSKPRLVKSICTGIEKMYQVKPIKGDSWRCNASHILSLKISGTESVSHNGCRYRGGEVVNITAENLATANKTFLHCAKLWRVGVTSWPTAALPLDPWVMGVWLGDGGTGKPEIHNPDDEVMRGLLNWCDTVGAVLRITKRGSDCRLLRVNGVTREHHTNPLTLALEAAGVLRQKHIPTAYKTGDMNQRLELLAGLIDTDGHHDGRAGLQFTSISEEMANDVAFVARSVGLAAYVRSAEKGCQTGAVGTYWLVSISGDTSIIPCRIARKQCPPRAQKKSALTTGFNLIEEESDVYFGFEIEGPDRLFLLGDFTVTHNTILFAFLAAHYQPKRTLIIAHREELLIQARDKIQKATGLWCEIEKAEQRASLDSPVVVASIQTLMGRMTRWPADHFDLVVVDEAHHVLADSYLAVLGYFDKHAKVLGVTATPDRGDKKNLGKYFEHIAFEVSIARLIREGWLSPIMVKTLPVMVDLKGIRKVGGDLSADELGERLNPWIEKVASEVAREAWDRKSVVFLPLVKTSERMRDALLRNGIDARCVSGVDKDRAETLRWFEKAGPGSALCNSMLLSEGFDQPDVDCIVSLRPTQMRALYAQMIGRGTRVVAKVDGLDTEARVAAIAASSKPHCLLLDFLWQTEKMSLVTAARLFSKCEDTVKDVEALFIAKAAGGGEVDVMSVCEDTEALRLKKVVEVLKANQTRPKGTHDAMEMCMSLGSRDLIEYEPMSDRDAGRVSDGQTKALLAYGFDPASVTCSGHASAILDRLTVRKMEGLASPKQVRLMERLHHPSPQAVSAADAAAFLNKKVWSKR